MTMGEYLKQLREERGMTQEELGKIVGVNRAAVSKWEKGHVENIKRSHIKMLSDFFHISPCDLMRWDEDGIRQKQACELFEQCYGTEAFETVSLFLQLDDNDRRTTRRMLLSMLEDEKYSIKKELRHA